MKRLFLSLIFIALFFQSTYALFSEIKGKITDKKTGEVLAGATLIIPDLKISALADKNGEFSLKHLPDKGKFLMVVRYVGYEPISEVVDFSTDKSVSFALNATTIEAKEIVITGAASNSSNKRSSVSVSVVNKDELTSRGATNIVDAISKTPGVSQITTGGAVSKPVIRGLSYNRVVTVSNGVKQEGQQWGDEHGIEIDQYGADRIEVLRGPASLLYGSDALGGVINVLEPLPAPEGTFKGEILSNYSTNNGLTSSSAMLAGNTNGFVYSGRLSYKNAYGFATPTQGHVPNSGFNETNFSGQLGLNKKWGFAHLNYSKFDNNIGLPEVEINNNGEFINEDGEVYTADESKSRKLFLPNQNVSHQKISLNSNLILGKGQLKTILGYQNNRRKEFEESASTPGLFFDLNTYSYDFKYYFESKNGWEPAIGISGMFADSKNKGDEFLVPDYESTDLGGFIYLKKNWTSSTLNFGGRFDTRNIKGKTLIDEREERFTAFENNFSNVTGAVGFTHEFDDNWSFKINAGSAFRAPNIAELASNGVHEGTFRYEIGNADLDPEKSFQLDGSVSYNTDFVSLSLGGYLNYINNYIYYKQQNNEEITADGDVFPVFRYVQADASLNGVEAEVTLHPLNWLHFENTFAYTIAENRETNKPLPLIPAANIKNELRFEPKIKGLRSPFLSVALDNNFRQSRIDDFETETSGYTLLNAGIGSEFAFANHQHIKLFVNANNILDKNYVNHLNRLKYEGIFNQGRNITFGFYLPLNFK